MGNISAKSKEQREKKKKEQLKSQEIDNVNYEDHMKERKVVKLLLLGAGESGKSTLFKQTVQLYGKGFDRPALEGHTQIIYRNILQGITTLVQESDRLPEDLKTRISPELKASKEYFLSLSAAELSEGKVTSEAANHIKLLWADHGIRNCYEYRARFQLPDSVNYYFQSENIDRIAKTDYCPNYEDILRCRSRTTGIVETEFQINYDVFKVMDVGGQRSERKKWMHCFEDVTAVIFVAAINEYDQTLYEDNYTNRIAEALDLFDKTCNSNWFASASIILFLNKRDLFEDKIKKVDMKCCFSDYTGGCDYEKATEFLKGKFLALNKSNYKVYTHITCATDSENVKFTFGAVKKIVISSSLKKSGLA